MPSLESTAKEKDDKKWDGGGGGHAAKGDRSDSNPMKQPLHTEHCSAKWATGAPVVMFWTEKQLMPKQQHPFWSCSQYKTALCSTFKQGLYHIIVAFYT